ncbi:MAG: BON domain-containing protein [Peptococcaceae bacterium]|nr:BON domain-containing protein [Peptococcaceae bacterium]
MDKRLTENKQVDLSETIRHALIAEMKDSGLCINVAAQDGVVSLWGIVDVLAEKLTAEKIAQQVYGVERVENGLTVAMDNFLPDKDINTQVLAHLAKSEREGVRKLGATTKDGIVYLLGHAPTLDIAHTAEAIAAGVRCVKDVVSQIKVGETDSPDDANVTNAVERAIANSGILDVRKINTSTLNGVVKFQGMVDSIKDIELAADIAYRIPGVRAIHSELKARHGATDGDRALTNRLRDMLSREKNLSRGTIKVHVVKGMAFLYGEVFDVDDRVRAEQLARQVAGITGISNTIQVSAHNLS